MERRQEINQYSNVQYDRQWIRRCKQEEINLIDSFAGPKANRI